MEANSKLKSRSARELKHKIAMAGYSSKQLAKSVGVTGAYLSAIINGGSNPSPALALKIVTELNHRLDAEYKISDFFFDTSVKKSTTLKEAIE